MTTNQIIADQIVIERTRQGIKFDALALASGMNKGALSKLERGLGNPTAKTLQKLSDALQIPLGVTPAKPHSKRGKK